MQDFNRNQPRLAPIPVPGQHHGPMAGHAPPKPVVVQQRPSPQHSSPQQMPPQMQRPNPQPAGAFPPYPPRDIIPPQLRRPVVVSDVRPEIHAENDIRESLSEYIIFSFEKVEPYNEYDSAGEQVKASWDNCIRRRMATVDKADALREIRRLKREDAKKGRTLLEKQNSLGNKGQDQLFKAQHELSLEEQDPRFHTVLAQFDFSLKPIVEKHEKVTRHRSNTKRKIHRKKRYERASITAYFKRCPRDNQAPSELARQIELEKQQIGILQPRQHQMQEPQLPPQRPHIMPHPLPQHPHVMPHPLPRSVPTPQANHMNHPAPPPPRQQAPPRDFHQAMPGHQPNNYGAGRQLAPIQVTQESRKRNKHHKRGQSRDSDSSDYSHSDWDSEDDTETTLITEPSHSSRSSKDRKSHGHRRTSLRSSEKRESFGEVCPARRHDLGEEQACALLGIRPYPDIHVTVPPREPAILVEELEQLRTDAYPASRYNQETEHRQRLAESERLSNAARRYRPRHAPRPEVIANVRHGTPSEVDRQLDDSFRHLRLGRDYQYRDKPDDLRCRDEQHRPEAFAWEEQKQIRRKLEEREARERRRRESPSSFLSPFASPSRRRFSVAYNFERYHRR